MLERERPELSIRKPCDERLGTHRNLFAVPLEEMTPAAFKKTLA